MKYKLSQDIFQKMVTLRRTIHQYPELSNEEEATSRRICQYLKDLGITYTCDVGKNGVVADIPGTMQVPYIVLRADIDALPIQEETDLEFSSTHAGVMHACGHDGHTAMLLGAAELLSQEKHLPAPVRLLFQPAEEKGTGARAMIAAGVLRDAGMIFGGHLDRHYQPGTIIVTEGPVNASSDSFKIEINGQGAHGARPHESVDAVVVGSLMVMALQTIVSREVDPSRPSVVSVGLFQAGTASNVIAGQARLEGTIRAQHKEVREHLLAAVKRIAESIAQLHGAKVNLVISKGTSPVINESEMASLAREAAIQTVRRGECPSFTYGEYGRRGF